MEDGGFSAELVGKRVESRGVKTFSFSLDEGYEYVSGQFAFLEFFFEGRRYMKHFTISSSPTREYREFTTIISDSDYKQALDKLGIGSRVELSGPMGVFTLDSRVSDRIAFLAGGIGVTPVRSMLWYLADTGLMEELEIKLFYSNRNLERIVFRDELEELSEKIDGLEVVHTLTDLSMVEEKGWVGETGYINRKMLGRYLEDLGRYTFYVVGPPAFNRAMGEMLDKAGVERESIIGEDFSGY
ncbi:MAG: FAD-binding oxidoreductase [Candidatus Altiarchaeota archaeon]|nr:FAD-binding oxidoreductase [Candidatus Altiarchaeota archaeon]